VQAEDELESVMLMWQLPAEPHFKLYFFNPGHTLEDLVAMNDEAAAGTSRRSATPGLEGDQPPPLLVEAYDRYRAILYHHPFGVECAMVPVLQSW
jgi:hypothetical protein